MNHLDASVVYGLRNLGWMLGGPHSPDDLLRPADLEQLRITLPHVLEQALTIWATNAVLSDDGDLLNEAAARARTAEYIRSRTDPGFTPSVPFETWELEYD